MMEARGPPRQRGSDAGGSLVPRGPVSEDVLAAVSERATAIFSSHKHRVSGQLEPSQGPYALALVGAMLGLNQKQLDDQLQLTQKVGRRSLGYDEFMSACEAMVALHGALAGQQTKRIPNGDMSGALRSAFSLYVKLNVGGFVGGDQRMNSQQFTKMCHDAGMMEPNGPASMSTLQISWASCKATFGSSRLQYNQFLKVLGALAAELSGDVFLLVAGLGLQLPTVPPLRNGFRKPDAGEVPKPEVVQGMGAHMAAAAAYEDYVEGGRAPDKLRDPLSGPRRDGSPIKARSSMTGGVPNWVKAMQADPGAGAIMTSGQDIRGIPVIDTPDSDDEAPRKPAPRKSMAPAPPPDDPFRAKASPMRAPRGGKLPGMGTATIDGPLPAPGMDPEAVMVIRAEGPGYSGPGRVIEVGTSAAAPLPMGVRPREPSRNGGDPDSPISALEPSILAGPNRNVRKSLVVAPEGYREAVEAQQAAVKALENRVEAQQQREEELFGRVKLLTEKLAEAQAVAAVQVQSGCPGAAMPDVPQAGRKVVSGRCPLTEQVEKLTEQMAEVLQRLAALESIKVAGGGRSPPPDLPSKTRNPIGVRTPEFEDGGLLPATVNAGYGPMAVRQPGAGSVDGVQGVAPLEPMNSTQADWMSRLLLNLDKRMRVLEGSAGKEGLDADGEAMAVVLKQLRDITVAGSPAPPAPAPPGPAGSSPGGPQSHGSLGVPDPAFLRTDHNRRQMKGVADPIDMTPALLPTGDPDLDRRLAALSNEVRSKSATVGLLLDMLNATRGEVAALAAQLAALSNAPPPEGAPGPAADGQASPSRGPQRNAIRVVAGGLLPPTGAALEGPARRAADGQGGAVMPLDAALETMWQDQEGVKKALREICAAVGVPAPLAVISMPAGPHEPQQAGGLPPAPAGGISYGAPTDPSAWGQPGRKPLAQETQEVKQQVSSVQSEVLELKRQVEAMRPAGLGEWPQPLRQDGLPAQPGVGGGQQAGEPELQQQRGRNPVQVMMGAPLPPTGFQPHGALRPLGAAGEGGAAPLPDAQLARLQDEVARVKAYVGIQDMPGMAAAGAAAAGAPDAPAGGEAGGQGTWADAGRGPRPLKDTVAAVAGDVDALRKHVKAMDQALRTNIGNTNNLTTFLNDNAPALMQAAEQAKEGGAAGAAAGAAAGGAAGAAGGRNPINVRAGPLQEPGMQQQQAAARKGPLPLQADGQFDVPALDPVEYQQLKDQVHSIARYLGPPPGEPAIGAAGSPPPPAPLPPGAAGSGGDGFRGPWGAPGRGGALAAGGTVSEGLGRLGGDVAAVQQQVAAMVEAMQAAGIAVPGAGAGQDGMGAAGSPEAAAAAARQRNAISVTPGALVMPDQAPLEGPQRTAAGASAIPALEPMAAARLADDVRQMKELLGIGEGGAMLLPAARLPGAQGEAGAAAAGAEPWGDKGRGAVFSRDVNDVDKVKKSVKFGALGDMQRDIDIVKKNQADLVQALKMANVPVPQELADSIAAAAQGAGDGQGMARQRNPISVSSGFVPAPAGQSLAAPQRPLQPLASIEGVPEPVLGHLGAMQDDIRRVSAFLGLTPTCVELAAAGQAPVQQPAVPGAPPRQEQQPWGSAPPPREPPPVQNLGELVRDVETAKQRQVAVERVLRSMGAMVPWDDDRPQQQQAQGQAPAGEQQQEEGQAPAQAQRQRNPIMVSAGYVPEGGAPLAMPNRRPMEPAESPAALQPEVGAMKDELRRVQAVLGIAPLAAVPGMVAAPAGPAAPGPAPAPPAGMEQWGQPAREPRQPGDPPRNMAEVVQDLTNYKRRTAQLEEAMRAAGIPVPEAAPDVGSWAGPAGSSPEQQAALARQRNAIAVSSNLYPGSGPALDGPQRKPGEAPVTPETLVPEVQRLQDEMRRMQAFMGVGPGGGARPAGPGVEPMRPAALPAEMQAMEQWGATGREPRMPGEPPRSMADVVQDVENNNRRTAQLEEAMRAAGIPIPPPEAGAGAGQELGAAGDSAQAVGQQKQRNPIQVSSGFIPAPSGPLEGPQRRGQPEAPVTPETLVPEVGNMKDEIRRVQAFLGMGPAPGMAMAAAAAPEADRAGAAPDAARTAEQWGGPGREPRQPGEMPRNMAEVAQELDANRRRTAQLEEAMRAAGIPIPPPEPAGSWAGPAGSSPEQQAALARQRNPIAVSSNLYPGGGPALDGPQRKPGEAPVTPETLVPEVQRLQDEMRRMQAFMGVGPGGGARPAGPGVEPMRPAALPAEMRAMEQWGAPGREPRMPGEPPRSMGDVLNEVDTYKQRMGQLEDAMKAAGIPLPPPPPGYAPPGVATGEHQTPGQQKQRNPIQVSSGFIPAPSGPLEGPQRRGQPEAPVTPETLVPEVGNMKDEIRRMQTFLGMGPAPNMATAPAAAPGQPAPAPDMPRSPEPWGQPGREPRQPSEPARNLGEMAQDVENNRKLVAQLVDAMQAAGIPLPPPPPGYFPPGPAPADQPQQPGQQKQRNPIAVSSNLYPGSAPALEGPQRKPGEAPVSPEALAPELGQLKDEVRRMQAFLGVGPAAGGPLQAGAAPEPARAATVPEPLRAAEPWGAPGREPRQPGEMPRNMGDVVRELDHHRERVSQLEDAMRAAGIPLPQPMEPGAYNSPAPGGEQAAPGQQKQRNPIQVSSGFIPAPSGPLEGPQRKPQQGQAPPESLPARVEALQDEVQRMKQFMGVGEPGLLAAAPAPPPKPGTAAAGADAGPWAGPGRERTIAGAVDALTRDVDGVKDAIDKLDRALRGAGMGQALPRELLPGAPPPAEEAAARAGGPEAERQRGGVRAVVGPLQPPEGGPLQQQRKEGPPIANPAFVDAQDYDTLRDDVKRIKGLLPAMGAAPGALAAGALPAKAGAVGAAAGEEPWAQKADRKEIEQEVKAPLAAVARDVEDLRHKVAGLADALQALGGPMGQGQGAGPPGGAPAGASDSPDARRRNPIAVTAGPLQDGAAKALAGPGGKGAVMDNPDGLGEPVLDADKFHSLKKAVEDLQNLVGGAPQTQPAGSPADAKKGKSLKEDTDDIKKFVRAMGKDVGAMGNDMQALKKHLDDVEGAMNTALANLAGELARLKAAREAEPEGQGRPSAGKLEDAGDKMNDTLNAMAALNAAQQQHLARVGDGARAEDIDALNEAMRQSENQLARLLAFLKQDVMDRFAVHEKTLIRMAKQIDFVQRMLKGEFDDQREAAREGGSSTTVAAPSGVVVEGGDGSTHSYGAPPGGGF